MRFVIVLLGIVATSVFTFAQPALDEEIETLVLKRLHDVANAVKTGTSACAAGSVGCDKDRLAADRAALNEGLLRAKELDATLLRRLRDESSATSAQALTTRHIALLRGIEAATAVLGSTPLIPAAEQSEQTLIIRIGDLSATVREETARCETNDIRCDLDRLARDRFALRDLVQRALVLDQELLAKLATTTSPSETNALTKRHETLILALEPARKISFVAHEGRSEAEDLVDRLKAVDEQLTIVERQRRSAKEAGLRNNDVKELRSREAELRSRLAELESNARAQGLTDRQTIAKIDETLKSGRLDIPHAKLVEQRRQVSKRLAEIEKLVTLPAGDNPLYRVYDDDYEDWWIHQFYLGGEFDSVSGILNRGFARVGYTSWWHTGGENIPESHPRRGFGNYGRHWVFNALLTSSAEQDVETLLNSQDAPGSTDPCARGVAGPCVRRALEAEQTLYWQLHRTQRHNRVRFYSGPLVVLGAKFVDPPSTPADDAQSAQADYRYYFGVRSGFGRDAYGDILYGRTRSLHTRRLEVRGEVPVAKWGAKSRLLLGWAANIRAGHKRPAPADGRVERDVYRIYVVYELDFLTLTGLKSE